MARKQHFPYHHKSSHDNANWLLYWPVFVRCSHNLHRKLATSSCNKIKNFVTIEQTVTCKIQLLLQTPIISLGSRFWLQDYPTGIINRLARGNSHTKRPLIQVQLPGQQRKLRLSQFRRKNYYGHEKLTRVTQTLLSPDPFDLEPWNFRQSRGKNMF